MIESHLVAGQQTPGHGLVYGQSITDACLGWDDTVELIERLAETVDSA
jgi:3-deoxy-7-phosphoheptulonate synthase